ncbi:MAG: hypothetical protein ABIK65_06950 [Candidatus Eisenbacteria bacterium]
MSAIHWIERWGPRVLAPALALALLAGCVERRTPQEPEIAGHPEAFIAQESSVDFHGDRVREMGAANCAGCHGSDFRGASDMPGCYECHDGPGGHPHGWAYPAEDPYHGAAVEAAGFGSCKECHGADLEGGWSGVSCWDCHDGPGGHPEGWLNPASVLFHGREAFREGPRGCARCHGYPPARGTSGVSCADAGCHD